MTVKEITLNRHHPIFRLPKSAVDKWFDKYSNNKVYIELNVIQNDDGSVIIRPK